MTEAGPNMLTAHPRTRDEPPVRLACNAMGTRFEAVLFGDDAVRLRTAGEAAFDAVLDWERRCNWFSPGSVLSHVNATAHEAPAPVDGELFALLSLCREVWEHSEGAFDVTIAPLMVAWGLRSSGPCAADGVDSARRCVGMDRVVLDERTRSVGFTGPGVSIDLGSIAKGAALDAAAAILRECRVESALVHGGTSSVVAIGSPPGSDAWTIAIETGQPARPAVRLRDRSLSVSAPRGRTVATDRGPAGHIMDPRTGAPAARAGTVAVTHPCGALCDAWSTALLVLGRRPVSFPSDMSALFDLTPIHENAA